MAVHETRPGDRPASPEASGWALGVIAFAATMMFLIGIFQALAGLVAIFDDEFYVVTQNYTYDIDVVPREHCAREVVSFHRRKTIALRAAFGGWRARLRHVVITKARPAAGACCVGVRPAVCSPSR